MALLTKDALGELCEQYIRDYMTREIIEPQIKSYITLKEEFEMEKTIKWKKKEKPRLINRKFHF